MPHHTKACRSRRRLLLLLKSTNLTLYYMGVPVLSCPKGIFLRKSLLPFHFLEYCFSANSQSNATTTAATQSTTTGTGYINTVAASAFYLHQTYFSITNVAIRSSFCPSLSLYLTLILSDFTTTSINPFSHQLQHPSFITSQPLMIRAITDQDLGESLWEKLLLEQNKLWL